MNALQEIILFLFLFYSILGFTRGSYFVFKKKNSYGLCQSYLGIGAFVWTDAVILGLFWIIVSILLILIHNWYLALLTYSLFWVVRSLGETVYWLNQQFSPLKRNPPETLTFLYRFFPNDSVWFVMQLGWQCTTVIMILISVYLTKLWIASL